MKRNSQPNPQPTATVDDLQRQRAELLKAQQDAHGRLDSAEPLDWRATSAASSDLQAIGAAIQAIDSKLAIARQDLAQATAADREAAQYEQRQAALSSAAAVTVQVVDALQDLDRGAMAELDKACDALAQCRATPAFTTMALIGLRREVAQTLTRLAQLDPVLMGKPAHLTAAELALNEARRDVQTAEAHLAELSQVRYGGNDRVRAVEMAGKGLELAQKRLAALEGKPYAVQALQSRVSLLLRSVPQPQPESELVA